MSASSALGCWQRGSKNIPLFIGQVGVGGYPPDNCDQSYQRGEQQKRSSYVSGEVSRSSG